MKLCSKASDTAPVDTHEVLQTYTVSLAPCKMVNNIKAPQTSQKQNRVVWEPSGSYALRAGAGGTFSSRALWRRH